MTLAEGRALSAAQGAALRPRNNIPFMTLAEPWRSGKERKGAERSGKERKGAERSGKERSITPKEEGGGRRGNR